MRVDSYLSSFGYMDISKMVYFYNGEIQEYPNLYYIMNLTVVEVMYGLDR